MNHQKKYYSILFAFVLLILIALQGYYIFNSYRLEEKDLKKSATNIAMKVIQQMVKNETDETDNKVLDYFKKLNHNKVLQYNELQVISDKLIMNHKRLTPIIDSLLNEYSKENGFKIALKTEIYSVFDEINKKELLPDSPMIVYESSSEIKNPVNVNLGVWSSDDISNEKDSDLGIDKSQRHKYKIRSKSDFELINIQVLVLKKIIPLIVISLLIVALIIFLYWKSMQNLSKQEEKINQLHLTIDSIAHELNTPITTMKFALQQIQNSETKEIMSRQINRLENTVESIFLNEESSNELLNESVLNEIIQQTKSLYPTIEIQNKTIFVNNLKLETHDFKLIFQNLIQNSVKYGASKIELDFKFQKQIALNFMDNGIGIPAKDLLHVFDKYYRVDRQINQNVNGLGVGLYLVKNCVARYNGAITVQNKLEKGVEFKIEIPNEN